MSRLLDFLFLGDIVLLVTLNSSAITASGARLVASFIRVVAALGMPIGPPVVDKVDLSGRIVGVGISALNPAPQRPAGVHRGTAPVPVVVVRSSRLVPAPVEVNAQEVALSSTESFAFDRSWLSVSAPVEIETSAAARAETTPLVSSGSLDPLLADVSVTVADDVPLLLVGTSRSSEELERSCLLKIGEVVSALSAFLPALCPVVYPRLGSSISIMVLFVPFFDAMLQ